MGEFDRSSKWLVKHHGDAILRLAGVTGVLSWKAVQTDLVQPAQLPDGLLEAHLAPGSEPRLFVLEIATYPERRVEEQALRDLMLVYLQHRVMPEVITLVLHPKGKLRVSRGASRAAPGGVTKLHASWKVVELWTVPASELLRTAEPGLMPWVPLTAFDDPPEVVLEQCREVIRLAPEEEQASLIAVTQVLTRLRYNEPGLLQLLGGRRMIESPLLDEIRTEILTKNIARVLRVRFGELPGELETVLFSIRDEARLEALFDHAVRCGSLTEFRLGLDGGGASTS